MDKHEVMHITRQLSPHYLTTQGALKEPKADGNSHPRAAFAWLQWGDNMLEVTSLVPFANSLNPKL